MPNEFAGLHIVVTGSTGALGRAVAADLLGRGAVCHLPVRGGSRGRKPEVPDASSPGRVVVHQADSLESDEAVRTLFADVRASLGGAPLWGLAHTVGTFHAAPIEQTTAADFHSQWSANAMSLFLCAREAAALMAEGEKAAGGRIAAVLARPALRPELGAGMTAYTAAKCAAAGFIASLGAELRHRSILVNALAPSIFDTPANRAAMPDADHDAWARPQEIARHLACLLAPSNTLTSGAVVPVYGRG